jgi:serine/threonine protein kinase
MIISRNMLLNGRNEIKLADLGISKLMSKSYASTYAGSKQYMSPEVFKAQIMKINYYPNTDIWYEIEIDHLNGLNKAV